MHTTNESSCTRAFLLLRNATASPGEEVSGILRYLCICVRICSRRFNVYHCDICGCTCIINVLAHLAIAVQSLQRHVIALATLARVATLANDSLLSRLLLPPHFVDDTERR